MRVLSSFISKFYYQFYGHKSYLSLSYILAQKYHLSALQLTNNKLPSKHVQTLGKKAKEATKTTYYTAIIIIGIGVTGLMFYSVFRELLSSFSPQAVYTHAVDKCVAHPKVTDMLGDNIKSYGEASRRGRRQHISHFLYELEGVKGMRMKFYLKGQRRAGTAHLDAQQMPSGFKLRYLFVQIDSYPYETIIIEDNRIESTKEDIIADI